MVDNMTYPQNHIVKRVSLWCLRIRLRPCLKCRFCLTHSNNKAEFLWHCPLWWPKWRQKKRASLKMHFNEKMVCNKSSKNRLFFWLVESIFCGLVLVIGTSKVYYLQLMCCGGSYLKEIMHWYEVFYGGSTFAFCNISCWKDKLWPMWSTTFAKWWN